MPDRASLPASQVEDTKGAIEKMVKDGKAPASLARVSEKLTSAQGLARRSVTATQGDVESRPALPRNESLQDTMSELQEAVQVSAPAGAGGGAW